MATAPQLITYLGLDKDPSEPEYSLTQRATLCYVAHAISMLLRRAKPCGELGLASPLEHPTYECIVPLLTKISIPLLQ